jgi:hypothetical protein
LNREDTKSAKAFQKEFLAAFESLRFNAFGCGGKPRYEYFAKGFAADCHFHTVQELGAPFLRAAQDVRSQAREGEVKTDIQTSMPTACAC